MSRSFYTVHCEATLVTGLKLVVPESARATGGEVSHSVTTVVELAAVCGVGKQPVRAQADLSGVL